MNPPFTSSLRTCQWLTTGNPDQECGIPACAVSPQRNLAYCAGHLGAMQRRLPTTEWVELTLGVAVGGI